MTDPSVPTRLSTRPTLATMTLTLVTSVLAALTLATGFSTAASASDGWTDVDEGFEFVRPMTFPLGSVNHYSDTWLAPRSSGRRHLGVDLMADKLVEIYAVRAGCVSYLKYGGAGGGNMLTLTDSQGWQYRYIHINNDTPGTDDGANPYEWAFTVQDGDCVNEGTHIAYVGDSGNAEWTGSHLHFEVRRADGVWINPYPSVKAAEGGNGSDDPTGCGPNSNPASTPDAQSARGYWLLDSQGRVSAHDAPHLGDLTTLEITTQAVSMTATSSGNGYWIVDAAGVVHAFGDATFHGDMSDRVLNGPIRRIEPHPQGGGYWLVAVDGGVFSFGTAGFHGSTGADSIPAPVISMTSTVDGDGYWLIGADGAVYTFGAASHHGSADNLNLNAPMIDMAVPPDGSGYWLYAADGGVFTYGDQAFHGSAPGLGRCDLAQSVALRTTDTGHGYWIVTAVGEVLTFGDAAHHGDLPDLRYDNPDDPATPLRATIIDLAVHHVS